MSLRSKSAINKGNIDISHLEREIQRDVATYRQYKAEDGMKKRAIHASKDYDEFRNFVSVSQLKPTSGHDVSNLFNASSGSLATVSRSRNIEGGRASVGGFDDMIQRRKDASDSSASMARLVGNMNLQSLSSGKANAKKSKVNTSTHATKPSRAAGDFLREWKQHCKTAKDTLSFLTRISDTVGSRNASFQNRLILQPEVTCEEYFSTEVDSDIVGDIVEALHLLVSTPAGKCEDPPAVARDNDASPHNIETGDCSETSGISLLLSSASNVLTFTHGWLEALPSCGRFELSVSFLLPEQRKKLKEVCDFLKKKNKTKLIVTSTCFEYDALLK